jgi:phospholipid transport system substrate-binding protein
MHNVTVAFMLALMLVLPARPEAVAAGGPTEQLRSHVDEVVRLLDDPALKANPEQRRLSVRRVSEGIFDYKDTARRSLGRHWAARTPAEQAEFVQLFSDLLDRAYFAKIEQYQGEKVRYADESIEGHEAVVKTRIVTARGSEVPVDYRMHLVNDRWRVYDVNIEGVSLVSNYRTQFGKIVQTESYEALVQKLRARNASPAASLR